MRVWLAGEFLAREERRGAELLGVVLFMDEVRAGGAEVLVNLGLEVWVGGAPISANWSESMVFLNGATLLEMRWESWSSGPSRMKLIKSLDPA